MEYKIKIWLKFGIFGFAALSIGGYSFYEARNIIAGPVINVYEPRNGTFFSKPLVEIKGNVKNISEISLNDKQITIDKTGFFSEKFLLSEGYNIIKIDAQDKFGRKKEKKLELVFRGDNDELVAKPGEFSHN